MGIAIPRIIRLGLMRKVVLGRNSPVMRITPFKRYAFEEAEHAAKFAELLGECVWDTKTNLEKRMAAEAGANEDKMRIARRAKELGHDAIHDTVHEMAKDEARHGQGFQGLYKRFFANKK